MSVSSLTMSSARILGRVSAAFGTALLAAAMFAPSSIATSSSTSPASTSSSTTSEASTTTSGSTSTDTSAEPDESDEPDDGRTTFTSSQPWADLPEATFLPDYDAIQDRMDEITEELNGQGRVGIALLDRATGTMLSNEDGQSPFSLASTTKIFIAEVVGFTNFNPDDGPMEQGEGITPDSSVQDNMLRDDAIRLSDNEATTSLWSSYGSRDIIESVKERYGLSDATVASGDWGAVTSSPEDLAYFFDGLLDGSGGLSQQESTYLTNLLYSSPKYSYGGTDQDFGLRAGAPNLPTGQKNGWVPPSYLNSAGFLGDDERFTMAVLTQNLSADDVTDIVDFALEGGDAITDPDSGSDDSAQILTMENSSDSGTIAGVSVFAIAGGAILIAALAYILGWMNRGKRTNP